MHQGEPSESDHSDSLEFRDCQSFDIKAVLVNLDKFVESVDFLFIGHNG